MSHVPFSPGTSSPPPTGGPTTPFSIPSSHMPFQYVSMSWAACRSSWESDAGWASVMLRTGPICGLWGAFSRIAWCILPSAMSMCRAAVIASAMSCLAGGCIPAR